MSILAFLQGFNPMNLLIILIILTVLGVALAIPVGIVCLILYCLKKRK
jgi:hypothetical protein